MQLKPFFTYYGGKYRIAPKYPQPQYETVIEPFAGSAGYALRYPERQVILNDLDPVIAGLWAYLISVQESEILSLPLIVEHVDELQVCQEAKHLIGFWLNKGTAAPCKTPSAWMRGGLRPNSYWGETIRARIASQLAAIRHWEVFNQSYESLPNVPATWFVDPPYTSGGDKYRMRAVNFTRLGDWCLKRRGQMIACESEGADWLPFEPFVTAKASEAKNGGKQCKEVIFTRTLDENDFADAAFPPQPIIETVY